LPHASAASIGSNHYRCDACGHMWTEPKNPKSSRLAAWCHALDLPCVWSRHPSLWDRSRAPAGGCISLPDLSVGIRVGSEDE